MNTYQKYTHVNKSDNTSQKIKKSDSYVRFYSHYRDAMFFKPACYTNTIFKRFIWETFFFYGEKSLYDPSMSKNTELIFGKVHDKFGKIKIFFHMMEGYCQIAVIDEITET